METKIKWFKEVLELEPSSKVFFPLARLYYDDGELDEAVSVLRHGLERDPDHMEAKFLLIEILMGTDQGDVVRGELESIVSLLSRYPGFWRAWAENFAPESMDSALALNFLALHFQGSSISWSQVIEKGLFALSSGDGGEAGATAAALSDDAGPRTRTMAELLAKQGDFKGALSIYEELAASCSESEKAELLALVEEMRARLGAGETLKGGSPKEAGFSLPGKEKLLSALESLAKRLEARVAL